MSSLASATAAYRDALGGTVTFQGVRAAGPDAIVYVRFGGGLVELLSGPAPDPSWGDRGLHHLGFISDDLDAATSFYGDAMGMENLPLGNWNERHASGLLPRDGA